MGQAAYSNGRWDSGDGLSLHYRDYPGRDDRVPIVCIPGLTRNARDFEPVAGAFAGEWRVLCLELRGRGDSDYARDSASYNPAQYVEDVAAFFAHTGITRAVVVGTSLGGIVTMLLGLRLPDLLAGAVLNDIGPVIEPDGMARIRDYVGQGRSFPTWMHAAWSMRDLAQPSYPDYRIEDWLRLSKRMMVLGGNGRIAFDYDMKIADPFANAEDPVGADLWAAFRALTGRPVLGLRGELSDILSAATFTQMATENETMEAVTIARVGHAPTFDEPESQAAIARLLARVA